MSKQYVIRDDDGTGLYYVGQPDYWSDDVTKAVTVELKKDLVRIRNHLMEVKGDVKIVELPQPSAPQMLELKQTNEVPSDKLDAFLDTTMEWDEETLQEFIVALFTKHPHLIELVQVNRNGSISLI